MMLRPFLHRNECFVASALWVALALCTVLVTGCSNQPELGKVSGIITVDGEPLDKAVVVFEPSSAPASRGVTDSSGRYNLVYLANQQGARLGAHRVRVFAGSEELQRDPLAHYRTGDELSAEVKSGANSFDFNLTRRPN